MGTKKDAGGRGEATRVKLIETAILLFGRRGYDAVTTRELATAAEANLSAIRYHCGDKDGLYRAALETVTAEIQALVDPRLSDLQRGIVSAGGNRDKLAALAGGFVEGWARSVLCDRRTQRRMPCIMREVTSPTKHFDLIYDRFYRPFLDLLALLIAALHSDDASQPAVRIRTHAALYTLLSFIEAESVFWRDMHWKRYTPERVEQMLPTLRATFIDVLGR